MDFQLTVSWCGVQDLTYQVDKVDLPFSRFSFGDTPAELFCAERSFSNSQ